MIETAQLGRVSGNFLTQEEFLQLCTDWLTSDQFHHIVTLNPEMVMEADKNDDFRTAVSKAEIRVPDGAGLIWARWYLRSAFWPLLPSLAGFMFHNVERITGVDAVMELASLCEQMGVSIYLLGGTVPQNSKAAHMLRRRFPTLALHSAPTHAFALQGPKTILEHIQKTRPAVLLVAYGSPKQTLWIEHNRRYLPSVKIAVGVGGAFAILSEERRRAPRMLRQFNLEWLWRLILEPRRLPRIWQATVRFPLRIQHQKTHHRAPSW
jgi:N-acetylglucosaminyldiphosphoundecaprenol N-acetyl-beta-D-mannosaminyltransferase